MWPFRSKKKISQARIDPPRTLPPWQLAEAERIRRKHEPQERVLQEDLVYGGSFGEIVSPWLQMLDGIRLMFPLFPVRFDYRWSNSFLFLTDGQLDLLRSYSRFAYSVNPYCEGALNCLADYTIGSGAEPYCQPKRYAKEVSKDYLKNCNKHLEDVLNANSWWRLQRELFIRTKRDGDAFVRFFPQDSAITKLRVVEPEQVRNTQGADMFGFPERSFGVVTDAEDRVDVLGYLVMYDNTQNTPDYIPAYKEGQYDELQSVMIGWTNILDLNAKRGISDFFSVQDTLEDANKLLRAGRLGEAARQAIAYIRQWSMANQQTIIGLQASNTDYQLPKEGLAISPPSSITTPENVTAIQAGEVHDVPEGMEFVNAPVGNGDNFERILHASLRAAAVKWRCPSWVLTGEVSENFASALVAESPMVRAREWDQKCILSQYKKVWTAILEIAARQGTLPEDVCEHVEVCCEPRPIAVRDMKSEAEMNAVLYQHGLLSKRTWSSRSDLDYDEETTNLKEEGGTQFPEMQQDHENNMEQQSTSPSAQYSRMTDRPE